jgi:hypothetical protein
MNDSRHQLFVGTQRNGTKGKANDCSIAISVAHSPVFLSTLEVRDLFQFWLEVAVETFFSKKDDEPSTTPGGKKKQAVSSTKVCR